MAYFVNGDVYRISLSTASATKVSSASVQAGSMAYDGEGAAILFLTESSELQRVGASTDAPELLREGVDAFWTVPNERSVLVSVAGKLELHELGDP
jgi:hypothetical protein